MAEWLVELQGHPAELGELADQFRSPQLNVRKEGERYYLRAPEEFGGLSDAGEVRTRATELLFLLSGIANLYAGTGETVTPGGVVIWERDDGTRHQCKQVDSLTLRVRTRIIIEVTKAIDLTVGESWLTLARQDDKVLDALHFFQEDTLICTAKHVPPPNNPKASSTKTGTRAGSRTVSMLLLNVRPAPERNHTRLTVRLYIIKPCFT